MPHILETLLSGISERQENFKLSIVIVNNLYNIET